MNLGAAALASVAAGVAAVIIGTLRWNRESSRAISRLGAATLARDARLPVTFSRQQLAGLPAPVARYFEFALTQGQTMVRTARILSAGEFSTRAGAWSAFTAVQDYS